MDKDIIDVEAVASSKNLTFQSASGKQYETVSKRFYSKYKGKENGKPPLNSE